MKTLEMNQARTNASSPLAVSETLPDVTDAPSSIAPVRGLTLIHFGGTSYHGYGVDRKSNWLGPKPRQVPVKRGFQ